MFRHSKHNVQSSQATQHIQVLHTKLNILTIRTLRDTSDRSTFVAIISLCCFWVMDLIIGCSQVNNAVHAIIIHIYCLSLNTQSNHDKLTWYGRRQTGTQQRQYRY